MLEYIQVPYRRLKKGIFLLQKLPYFVVGAIGKKIIILVLESRMDKNRTKVYISATNVSIVLIIFLDNFCLY